MRVEGLPDGFYLKAVRSGEADALVSGLRVGGVSPEPLEIVVSANAGRISGSITNPPDRQRVANAVVALVPREKERVDDPGSYRDATADENGSFTFKNLPPGRYKLYAWEDVEASAWMDPEFIKPLEGQGVAVDLGEGGQEDVQLRLIPSGRGGV